MAPAAAAAAAVYNVFFLLPPDRNAAVADEVAAVLVKLRMEATYWHARCTKRSRPAAVFILWLAEILHVCVCVSVCFRFVLQAVTDNFCVCKLCASYVQGVLRVV